MNMARVYDPVRPGDGTRVMVDRLWPRGIRKTDPRVGLWLKDVAPSTELRHWYGHDPAKQQEFARRYNAELKLPVAASAVEELRAMDAAGPVTLVTAAKSVHISHVPVLAAFVEGKR